MTDVLRSQILLVDDHPLFREGLARALSSEPDLQIAADVGTAAEAVEIVRHGAIDIAVIDVLLAGTSGISLATELLEVQPDLKILGLSVLEEPTIIGSMLRAGATGYALKNQPPGAITAAIRTVLAGERYVPPCIPQVAILSVLATGGAQSLHRLTPREREIFDLLIKGLTNEEIGSRLFIARRTVETHRQRIMKKLDTHSLLDMIRVAAREGALAR
jgi:DNA-binding NarL/FixJ family response regulator